MQVVLNYELPADATDYIHRVGRTARAGRGGLSMSVVTEHDINILLNIEEKTGKNVDGNDRMLVVSLIALQIRRWRSTKFPKRPFLNL